MENYDSDDEIGQSSRLISAVRPITRACRFAQENEEHANFLMRFRCDEWPTKSCYIPRREGRDGVIVDTTFVLSYNKLSVPSLRSAKP